VKDEQFRAYDSTTGERIAVINLTGKKKTKRRFVMVFIDIPSMACNPALADFDLRLLMFLFGQMNESNEIRLMQDEIAKELGVGQPTVSKSLSRLRKTHYLSTPRRGIIAVSPEVAWRGPLTENAKVRP
jgi:hypothetical protein